MKAALGLLLALLYGTAVAADEGLPPELASAKGQVLYLDFWASWCGPCARSFPWLNQMHERYGDRITIVGVDVDTDRAAADRFLAAHHAEFAILFDPSGALAERYQLKGMPTSLIVDRQGHVLHRHEGFRESERADYEAAIAQAIGPQR
jgi:thiol-disulfide isomerase/thioredoxin